ncbi:MAG: polysaccharide deacetylase family protein [Acidobacteria bacterium]|nr:polysaccharide deacetylase family protein [Acidobacteriota bacterium]
MGRAGNNGGAVSACAADAGAKTAGAGSGRRAPSFERGVFTVSLDFELMWGSFDSPKFEKFLAHFGRAGGDAYAETRGIVERLLALFRRYDVRATWATVGHLFLERCEERAGVKHPEMPRARHTWFARDWYEFDPCRSAREEPLWYGRDMVLKILAAEPRHDLGSHSFSHVIFGDAGCTREVAEAEVRRCVELAGELGLKLESFVFPRNRPGHLDVLREHGFSVARGEAPFWFAKFRSRTLRRAGHVMDDLLAVTPDCGLPLKSADGVWIAPVSMFLQSMDGARRLIPARSRVRKATKGIERAVREKTIFHLSFHPTENLCFRTDEMFRALEEIVAHAARRRDEGALEVMTMADIAAHCERRAGVCADEAA